MGDDDPPPPPFLPDPAWCRPEGLSRRLRRLRVARAIANRGLPAAFATFAAVYFTVGAVYHSRGDA